MLVAVVVVPMPLVYVLPHEGKLHVPVLQDILPLLEAVVQVQDLEMKEYEKQHKEKKKKVDTLITIISNL